MSDALEVIDRGEQPTTQALTLFGTADPVAVLDKAAAVAKALARVIAKQQLFTVIGTKKYVHVEGWTLLGSMLGVFPRVEWSRKLENGWEARVEAVVASTGAVIGAGEAECLRSEGTWAKREDYALRGMAQTRAISRAMRGPLGFVVQLAGFATTPAEEMPTANEEYDRRRAVIESQGAGTPPPLSPTPASPGAASPPQKTAEQIFSDTRAKIGSRASSYDDVDAVCPACGRKEFLRPANNPRFCAKADGGCGHPPRGETMQLISYGEFQQGTR